MKYFTRIQKLGKDSLTFLGDPDSNFIILFNDNAPPAFEDLCVLHTIEELRVLKAARKQSARGVLWWRR